MYVCVYIYIYIHMYTYIHIYIHPGGRLRSKAGRSPQQARRHHRGY